MTHHARASSLSSSSQSITALEAKAAPMESTSITSSFEFCNLFVYGTLMAPEIMESLLGRKLPGLFVSPANDNDNNNNNSSNGDDHQLVQPARLWGYQRHPVLGECYPGLIAAVANSNRDNSNNMSRTTNAFTDGLLYRNVVTIAERDSVLDDYEGADYTRTPVTVQLIESSTAIPAIPTTTASANNDIMSTSGANNNNNSKNEDWIAAETYVWTNSVTQLDLTQSWSYEEFRKVHLPNYSLGQQIA